VLKRHARNTKDVRLNMKFSFWPIVGIKTLRVEGIGYNVERHKKNTYYTFRELG
jgi:hypothetical protein